MIKYYKIRSSKRVSFIVDVKSLLAILNTKIE